MAHPGFIGSAWIKTNSTAGGFPAGGGTGTSGISLLLSGGSLNPVQDINAPDNLMQGQIVKHVANYGKVEVGGNIQAPIDEFHKSIFDAAWYRAGGASGNGTSGTGGSVPSTPDHMCDQDITIKISYYRTTANNARVFNNLAINTYEVSVTAGDVATFSAEFMGVMNATKKSIDTENKNTPAPCTKLVTWDRCKFICTSMTVAIQSFTFSVNNNLQKVYKIKSNAAANDPSTTLYPVELVAGFRDVTGTIVAFAGDAGQGDTAVDGSPEVQFPPAGWTAPFSTTQDSNNTPAGTHVFGAENYDAYTMAATAQTAVKFTVGGGTTPIIDQSFNVIFKRPEAAPKTDLMTYTLNWVGIGFDPLT